MDEIPAAALEKCLQSYKRGSKYSGSYPEVLADSIYGTAKGRYEAQIREIYKGRQAAKTAENEAKLKQEEPAIIATYRDCIFSNAARLALVSDESPPKL